MRRPVAVEDLEGPEKIKNKNRSDIETAKSGLSHSSLFSGNARAIDACI